MKNIVICLVIALSFMACQGTKDNYSIKGSIAGVDTGKVYLQKVVNGRPQSIDTADVVDGKFEFSGKMDVPDFRILRLNEQDYFAQFFLDNSNIKVAASKDSLLSTKITGSESHDIFKTYLDEVEKMNKELVKIQEKYQSAMASGNSDEAKKAEIDYNAFMENNKVFTKNFVKEHNTSTVAAYITLVQLSSQIESAEMDSIVNKFPQEIAQSEYVIRLKEIADGMRKTAVGVMAPDFTMNDPEGKPIQLSSLRGKVVMIDFWAAWCGPCRRENPNVVKLYQQYHDKGFEILGVSLDQKKEDWVEAIQQDQLSWLHVSDLQHWQSSAARLYAVSSIPQTFLLDKEGKIIAKGLRSEQLAAKLNELFPQ
ncbi:MAG TPA: TlpA disulfide reductase family protein [Prolixibacteraceae bacterium]|nr:TlpA disulfide reductase family protein [Prolixibacteraceae bacterium]